MIHEINEVLLSFLVEHNKKLEKKTKKCLYIVKLNIN